jgi:hypothetical protein
VAKRNAKRLVSPYAGTKRDSYKMRLLFRDPLTVVKEHHNELSKAREDQPD